MSGVDADHDALAPEPSRSLRDQFGQFHGCSVQHHLLCPGLHNFPHGIKASNATAVSERNIQVFRDITDQFRVGFVFIYCPADVQKDQLIHLALLEDANNGKRIGNGTRILELHRLLQQAVLNQQDGNNPDLEHGYPPASQYARKFSSTLSP